MSLRNPLLKLIILFATPVALLGAESEGVSPAPYVLFGKDSPFPITNTILTGWVITALVVIGIRLMVGKMNMIPSRGQGVIESLVDALRGLFTPIVGNKAMAGTFPLLLCLFVFILMHNWSGLLPGVGTFGYYDDLGHLKYWMRPVNSDLSMTAGLAIFSMVAWLFLVLKYAGAKLLLYDLFGNKANPKETPKPIYIAMWPIFIAVGLIEIVSICVRPISLSFRLYGNIYGGENMLDTMTRLFGFIIPLPVYFYELLVGVIQALIFTMLVAIYIGLITNHEEEDHAH